jgi:hypothetical protein
MLSDSDSSRESDLDDDPPMPAVPLFGAATSTDAMEVEAATVAAGASSGEGSSSSTLAAGLAAAPGSTPKQKTVPLGRQGSKAKTSKVQFLDTLLSSASANTRRTLTGTKPVAAGAPAGRELGAGRPSASSVVLAAASTSSASAASASATVAADPSAPSASGISNKAPRIAVNPPGVHAGSSVLDDRDVVDSDELYMENERALNNFLKLHPMLSLDATNERLLTAVAELCKDCAIETKELETVSKTHDDDFLRPAIPENGERKCVADSTCVCRWLAINRYGEGSMYEFVCREYLLPSQLEAYKTTGKYSKPHGKCLVCTRYFTTYVYTLARNSPTFCANSPIALQAFANQIECEDPQAEALSHSSRVGTEDGYNAEAMLFVDERWTSTRAARDELGTLLWKPVVRYNSQDYVLKYNSETSKPYMIQFGMGTCDPSLSDFVRPSLSEAERARA